MKQPVYCLPNSLTILRKYQQINETESDIQKRMGIAEVADPMQRQMLGNQPIAMNSVNSADNRIGMGQGQSVFNSISSGMQMQNEAKPEQQPALMQMPLKQPEHNF
jgi:hypothetical protein